MATEEKELDLIDICRMFFKWIINLFKNIGKGILTFIRFTFKNLLTLFIAGLIGLIIAFILSSNIFRVYKSDAIFKMNNEDDLEILVGLVESLDKKVISEVPLYERLNISEEDAEAITSIKPHYVIDFFNNGTPDEIDYEDEFVEKDTTNVKMKDRICVEVITKNPYSFSQIQSGLLHFFNNNSQLRANHELKLKQIDKQIASYQREINRLDSLSNFDYFNEAKRPTLTVDSQAIMLGEKPRQLYYTDIAKLESRIDNLELELMKSDDVVSTIKPFTATLKPVKGFFKLGVIYGSVFLVLGYIIALLRRYGKQMLKFLQDK